MRARGNIWGAREGKGIERSFVKILLDSRLLFRQCKYESTSGKGEDDEKVVFGGGVGIEFRF